jgi:uncharacterized membrane protein (UPF0127 family)
MIIRLPIAGRMIVICAIVISISTSADLNNSTSSFSNATGGEQNQSPPKGITIPNDRYLQARVIVNGVELNADLAVTEEQQTKGLAVKDHLKENEGMLFVYEQPSRQEFWMKDMKFPIDIIWLDSNGTVVHIEHNLQPCVSILNTGSSILNCPTYTPDKDSLYVLETVAGFSQKYNVTVGTHIDFYLLSLA